MFDLSGIATDDLFRLLALAEAKALTHQASTTAAIEATRRIAAATRIDWERTVETLLDQVWGLSLESVDVLPEELATWYRAKVRPSEVASLLKGRFYGSVSGNVETRGRRSRYV